ncbi:hypothetical protein GCM10025865_31490 [Paraoerskovia sediminicola]|uniref:DUF58 domain-containing protein n=1 Tax=Paraoerskovia sediminicola TaxID=1138587 RepID=A0ABN6XGF5_9CELL|nr:DUF58 domain-containing protein [Paraoerskovia sediminicola]BDZ43850.1 hypothetical protein GCM10025865_31490 [Paraoerskovia sediminicola]
MSSRQLLGAPTTLSVRPATVPLPIRSAGMLAEAQRTVHGRGAASPEDTLVREYTVGDDPRRVHWTSAARHGRLMVRAEESAGLPEATVLLDPALLLAPRGPARDQARAARPDASRSTLADWAVDLGASVALSLLDAGYRTRLVGPDGRSDSFDFGSPRTALGTEHLFDVATDLAAPEDAAEATSVAAVSVRRLRGARHRGEIVVALVARATASTPGLVALGASGPTSTLLIHGGTAPSPEDLRSLAALRTAGHRASAVPAGCAIPEAWSRAELLGGIGGRS